jgi:hypothetical protein
MYWLLFALGAALFTAGFVGVYWQQVANEIASWLRSRGLEKNSLMDAWVQLDRQMTKIRSRVFVKNRRGEVIQVSVKTLSLEQVDDPEVRALLARQSTVHRNVMPLVQ